MTPSRGTGLTGSDRVRDLLDCVTTQKLVLHKDQERRSKRVDIPKLMSGTIVDTSQSHERRCFSFGGKPVNTITTSSALYSFSLDSIILPSEVFLWHGFPRVLAMPSSTTQTKNLIGNSMCAPVLRPNDRHLPGFVRSRQCLGLPRKR